MNTPRVRITATHAKKIERALFWRIGGRSRCTIAIVVALRLVIQIHTGRKYASIFAQHAQNSPVELGVVVVFSARLSGDIYGVIQFASDTRGGRNKERAIPIYYRVAWTNATNGWSKWAMINTTDV